MNPIFGEKETKRIAQSLGMALIFLSLFLVLLSISAIKRLPYVGREVYPQSTIMVTGEGEAVAIPDIATFSFTVTEAGESVEAAQGLLDEKISKALAILKDAAIDEKDIKTANYYVYPKYEWRQKPCVYSPVPVTAGSAAPSYYPCPAGTNELIGYEVNETINVKVRDIKKAGDLVSKIGSVNVSNISGVEFTVDKREEFVSKAREEAINKAKDQAKVLSNQLGVRLGKILYFNEAGNYLPTYYGYAEGKGGGGDIGISAPLTASLPQGETKITSTVNITYEIK